MKKKNKLSWLAWLWFSILLIVILVNLPDRVDLAGGLMNATLGILDLLFFLAFPLVGALIISRQPQNTIGWLLMVPSFVVPFDMFARSQIIGVTAPPSHPSIFFLAAVTMSNTTWLFAPFPVFLIALLFPTGKSLSPRWRWVLVYALSLFFFFLILAVFNKTLAPDPSLYGVDWSIPNPLGFFDISADETLFSIWFAGLIVLVLLCVASIVLRYRRAAGVERKQIKWLLYAISLFGIFYVPYLIFQSWGEQIWAVLVDLGLINIPLAIGIAILRYRLFDIDVIIRKTLQYGLLTGLLALVYFGSVILLQNLTENLFGEQSPLVIVLSTLTIAALSGYLRKRVQDFIDRRFYRKKYNAELALAHFAATARDEVELDQLTAALLGVVEETMQPEMVSLWLKPLHRERN